MIKLLLQAALAVTDLPSSRKAVDRAWLVLHTTEDPNEMHAAFKAWAFHEMETINNIPELGGILRRRYKTGAEVANSLLEAAEGQHNERN